MPTYVYENARGQRYEFDQRMRDQALTAHPQTGEAIRRVPALVNVAAGAAPSAGDCASGACTPSDAGCALPQCGTGACAFN